MTATLDKINSETAQKQSESLGRALTALGLEDKFLSNGELKNFPLMQRAQIANEIIADKLSRGRWTSVVDMIYGGFGKADALYDGDREQLKAAIVESAKKNPEPFDSNTAIQTLAKHHEDDLIFRLASTLPMKYEEFTDAVGGISDAYFADSVPGESRKQAYHGLAAQKALKEGRESDAFTHFKTIGDENGIATVFDMFVEGYSSGDNLGEGERFAESSSPKVKESRLRKLVSIACNAKNRSRDGALSAWHIVKNNKLELSEAEKKRLYDSVAETARDSDIRDKLAKEEPELALLWAKKHVKESPLQAYSVFRNQKYSGEEVLETVRTVLSSKDRRRSLDEPSPVSHFAEEHLNAVYAEMPFEIRTSIAFHLKDAEKFQALSKEALDKKDFKQAYDFWGYGKGDLKGDYAFKLKEMLINQHLDSSDKWFHLNPDDSTGHVQAYEAYMAAGFRTNDPAHFETAYEYALRLHDEPKTQAAREKLVKHNPLWALGVFEKSYKHEHDTAGVNYVLQIVGQQTGVPPEKLKGYLEKYTKQEKR